MSSATPSHQTSAQSVGFLASCAEQCFAGVRAIAFWAAALLPLLVLVALVTGVASRYPSVLTCSLAVNVVCAVIGHGHSPN